MVDAPVAGSSGTSPGHLWKRLLAVLLFCGCAIGGYFVGEDSTWSHGEIARIERMIDSTHPADVPGHFFRDADRLKGLKWRNNIANLSFLGFAAVLVWSVIIFAKTLRSSAK